MIALSSPLQRPAIRTLLGCALRHFGGTEKKDDVALDSGEQRSCEQALEGPWDPFWCQLCIASNRFCARAPLDLSLDCVVVTVLQVFAARRMLADPKFTVIKIRCFTLISGVGLDRLPAGAVLLTLEVPSNIGSGQWNHAKKEGKKEEDPYTSQKNKAGALFHGLSATEGPSGNSSTEDLPLATAAKKISDGTEVSRVSSKNMDVLTGGNFTQAVALAAIEAADVLLISLLHEGRLFKPWSHDTQGVRPLGEFLCLGDTAVAGEDADMTAVPRQTSHSIRPSSANETEPANRQACLPEHISKLLYTMRQLLEENRVRRNGESGQFSTHPRDSSHQLALETGRPQRLPRVVILTEVRA